MTGDLTENPMTDLMAYVGRVLMGWGYVENAIRDSLSKQGHLEDAKSRYTPLAEWRKLEATNPAIDNLWRELDRLSVVRNRLAHGLKSAHVHPDRIPYVVCRTNEGDAALSLTELREATLSLQMLAGQIRGLRPKDIRSRGSATEPPVQKTPTYKAPSVTRCVIGFDSAWTDNAKAPGAICLASYHQSGITFTEPKLVSFSGALAAIRQAAGNSAHCLVAIDQPTIVPNLTGMRPVDKVAASIISWAGGGVQPANRSKVGMFDDAAPLWAFKAKLNAQEDPDMARCSESGLHMIEVFPALALLSIGEMFCQRLKAPRYNPARRKTFNMSDWLAVFDCVSEYAQRQNLLGAAAWCQAHRDRTPTKALQDMLDSVICLLIGISWITASRDDMILVGDTISGYMVSPASNAVRARLHQAAYREGTPIR